MNETMQKLETIWTEHSLQSIEETNEDIMSDAEQRFVSDNKSILFFALSYSRKKCMVSIFSLLEEQNVFIKMLYKLFWIMIR